MSAFFAGVFLAPRTMNHALEDGGQGLWRRLSPAAARVVLVHLPALLARRCGLTPRDDLPILRVEKCPSCS
jgi:hypothetical protein